MKNLNTNCINEDSENSQDCPSSQKSLNLANKNIQVIFQPKIKAKNLKNLQPQNEKPFLDLPI